MRNTSEIGLWARGKSRPALSLVPERRPRNPSVLSDKADRLFVQVIADIVFAKYEMKHFELYSEWPEKQKSGIAGEFLYKVREFYYEMQVEETFFKWDESGLLISASEKTEEEWINWIRRL